MRGATRAREREQAIIAAGWTRSSPTRYSSDEMQSGSKNCSGGPQSAFCHCVGRVAEWFKAAVLKIGSPFHIQWRPVPNCSFFSQFAGSLNPSDAALL